MVHSSENNRHRMNVSATTPGWTRLGVEYQPLLDPIRLDTVGHEALSRFQGADGAPIPPQSIFQALHDEPAALIQLELDAKRLQLAQAPPDGLLFVNVDPDAFGLQQAASRHPMLELLGQRSDVVVEIIENASVQEAALGLAMAALLATRGIATALDDIGALHALVSLELLLRVDYLKLDRSWLRRRGDANAMRMLRMLVGFARERGARTVLEGIENAEDLAFARSLGVDLVQGFLFRERFVQAWA